MNKKFKAELVKYDHSNKFDEQMVEETNVDIKLIKLSINVFRTTLFVIVSISILATDFRIFDRTHRKTLDFGVSLMDLGVGLFTICHSLKVIRNPKNDTRTDTKDSFFK